MKKPIISFSVIIPTHNRNDILSQAIKSVLSQEYKPLEILIVDDIGLTDTHKLVKKINKTAEFNVKYILNNEKKGAIRSRNIASKIAVSSYLAFLDDDDYWDRKYLKKVVKIILKTKAKFIATQYSCFDENDKITSGKKLPENYLEKDFYLKNPGILCSNEIIEKNSFNFVGGYDEFVLGSCDKDLLIKIKRNGFKHTFIRDELVYWRIGHKDQWSKNMARVLPSVRRFYIKYFFRMNIYIHLKMLIKILKLTYLSMKRD